VTRHLYRSCRSIWRRGGRFACDSPRQPRGARSASAARGERRSRQAPTSARRAATRGSHHRADSAGATPPRRRGAPEEARMRTVSSARRRRRRRRRRATTTAALRTGVIEVDDCLAHLFVTVTRSAQKKRGDPYVLKTTTNPGPSAVRVAADHALPDYASGPTAVSWRPWSFTSTSDRRWNADSRHTGMSRCTEAEW
jgi:hypothetical protein